MWLQSYKYRMLLVSTRGYTWITKEGTGRDKACVKQHADIARGVKCVERGLCMVGRCCEA